MQRIAAAALALLATTLVGCGGTPEPPPPAQLLEDVRHAMETAPSFRFEADVASYSALDGEHSAHITGEASGDDLLYLGEPTGQTSGSPGGMAIVDGKVYLRDGSHWSNLAAPPDDYTSAPRRLLIPPGDLSDIGVHETTLDGERVWIVTARRLLLHLEGTSITTSIPPFTTYEWVVEPATSRLLLVESTTDFGIVTYPNDSEGASGPQNGEASWRFFDYDADIAIAAPQLSAAPAPTPWPTATPTPAR